MAIVFSLGEEMGLFASVPVGIIGYVILFAYVLSALGNIYFNSTALANHGFMSNLKVINVGWIYFTNIVGIILTAGLFIPWAQVRMARYRAETLVVLVDGSLDGFIADVQGDTSALGEEVGGMFDVDVSFV